MTDNKLSLYEQTVYNTYIRITRLNKGFTPRKNFNNLKNGKAVSIKSFHVMGWIGGDDLLICNKSLVKI